MLMLQRQEAEKERDQSLTRLKQVQMRYGRLVESMREFVPLERQSFYLGGSNIFFLRNGTRRSSPA